MIKINLLRALKDGPDVNPGEGAAGGSPLKSFLARLFPQKKAEGGDVIGDGESEESSANLGLILVKLILICSVAGGLFYYESINVPRLENKLAEENQKLSELMEYNNKAAEAVNEIKKLQEVKQQIEKQIESLDGLSKLRVKYVKAIDLIQTNIPEKMWFLNMASKENNIEISGISLSENEITQFVEVLSRSVYFSDVSMLSSEDVGGREGEAKKFKKFTLNLVLESNK